MFGGVINRYKKAEAAVVIENLLTDVVSQPLEATTPAAMANQLVRRVWDSRPDIFEGKFGRRPLKLSIAACALASGLDCFPVGSINRATLTVALGIVMGEIGVNGRLYDFGSADLMLIEFAEEIYREAEASIAV